MTNVLYFESTGEAYDETQTNEAIKDGDVLVVKNEQVVGFLYKAWPVAVTSEVGAFHFCNVGSPHTLDGGKYITSVLAAEVKAKELGYDIR